MALQNLAISDPGTLSSFVYVGTLVDAFRFPPRCWRLTHRYLTLASPTAFDPQVFPVLSIAIFISSLDFILQLDSNISRAVSVAGRRFIRE